MKAVQSNAAFADPRGSVRHFMEEGSEGDGAD
jgi:hypothetical protein